MISSHPTYPAYLAARDPANPVILSYLDFHGIKHANKQGDKKNKGIAMIKTGGVIDIGLTLQHPDKVQDFYDSLEITNKRIERLGLMHLISQDFNANEMEVELAYVCARRLSKMKKKRHPKSKDFIKAIEFLEIFCMYAAQRSTQRTNYDFKNHRPAINRESQEVVDAGEKAIDVLAISRKKNRKNNNKLKEFVNALLKSLQIVKEEDLNPIEQLLFAKDLEYSERILKRLCK